MYDKSKAKGECWSGRRRTEEYTPHDSHGKLKICIQHISHSNNNYADRTDDTGELVQWHVNT